MNRESLEQEVLETGLYEAIRNRLYTVCCVISRIDVPDYEQNELYTALDELTALNNCVKKQQNRQQE